VNSVVGVADHSGWANCVTVAVNRGVPVVVDRRRLTLIGAGLPNQPYEHGTVGMALPDAERLLARVRESILRTTLARVTELRDELQPPYTIVAMTLRTPTLPSLPATVAEAHASSHVTNRADGMLYHHALCTAARRLRIRVELQDRGSELPRAADRLGVSSEDVELFLRTTGEELGAPWQKEHRLATAAAIAVLADRTRLSLFA
jgi:hypothetical protein